MSHMRANTSLMGHLLGSSKEIEGYYELHMGYYSWKSLLRQKLRHFERHPVKPSARFMFDKVLHDDHYVDLSLFKKGKVIFSLRPPERTIPSIVSLYRSVEPGHPYTSGSSATRYYVDRVRSLGLIAQSSPVDFLYLDADALREKTSVTLRVISDFLGLEQPLPAHYEQQVLTGTKKVGDSSESITSGTIKKVTRSYDGIKLSEDDLKKARRQYLAARAMILDSPQCASRALLDVEH